ncbi:MAG: hypothetical protein ACR2NU_08200 [Aeoliella sp.]
MSTSTSIHRDSLLANDAPADDALEYRALYSGALVGVLLGLMSISLLFTPEHLSICLMLAPIPLVGMFVSLRSWLKIRRERDLYTGGPLALVGLALSLVFLTAGVGWASYIYATEVPDGYQRISFFSLKPDQTEKLAGKPIPDDIVALIRIDEPIFIKGYIRPDSLRARRAVDSFLLVRDDNQCCFGDLSKVKYFDQIAVRLVGSLRTDYDKPRLFRVGGKLAINPHNLAPDSTQPVYYLEADYIE